MNFERPESLIKTIVDGIVVKRGFLADSFESDTSRKLYHKYKNAVEKTDKIEYHDLLSVDFTGTNLVLEENIEAKRECLADPKKVYSFLDEIELEQMLTNIRTRVINTYVEKNPYYRILMGLPSLVDSVYLYVGSEYSSQIDITKPIHEMNESEIKILYDAGVLTELAETYPTKQYIGYLHRKVDLITARDADDFTILKMPHIEGEEHICDYFLEAYNNHLDNFIRRHINIFYQRTTDYYESIVCMILLWATRMDTIREMSTGIDYDYYDDYDLAAIFQDYSIKMNDLVPRELRIDIAKNINLLVRNRGTNEVMKNLSDIFGLSNIYNYVIHKVYNNFGESQIRCHAVPVGDMKNTRKYLMREYGFISYGKLVENDRTWTDRALSNMSTKEMRKLEEGQEYVNIYDKLMQKDFSYIHSKYIAIDNIIDMGQTSLDFSLFFNYMLEYSGIYNTVFVHHRYSNAKINILNMYVYLCALMSTKYKFVDTIASNASEVKYILALNDKINFRAVPYDRGVSNTVTVEIMDLVELFEVNFAGTEYANILANWLSFNPTGTFEEFIDVFCHDRKLVYAFKQIMRETYDHEQYNVAKIAYDYSTRVAAKTSVFGNVVTYSDYLKNTAPKLHEYFISLKENTTEDKWSEVFANEITYCLSIFRDLIDSLDNVFYKDSFNFIEDLRDTQINELKNVLSYLVQYFSSMTMTVRDPNFKYELGDIDDHYLAREEQFKARSDKRSNDFEHAEERLFLYRKRNIDDERFVIKERVMVKYNNLKYRVIGGDNE